MKVEGLAVSDQTREFVARAMRTISEIDTRIKQLMYADIEAVQDKYPDKRLDIQSTIRKLKEEIESGSAVGKELKRMLNLQSPADTTTINISSEEAERAKEAASELLAAMFQEITEVQKKHSPEMEQVVLKEQRLRAKLAELAEAINESNIVDYFAGEGERGEITQYLRDLLPTETFEKLQVTARSIKQASEGEKRQKIPYKKFWIPTTGILFLALVAFIGLVSSEDLKFPAYAGIGLLAIIGGQIVGGILYGLYRLILFLPIASRVGKIEHLITKDNNFAAALNILLELEHNPNVPSKRRPFFRDLKKTCAAGAAAQKGNKATEYLNQKQYEKAGIAYDEAVSFIVTHLDWLEIDKGVFRSFLNEIQQEMNEPLPMKEVLARRDRLRELAARRFRDEVDVGVFGTLVDCLIGSVAAKNQIPKSGTRDLIR